MLVRLAKTILSVLANPNRTFGWKVFDVLFLSAGVLVVVMCLISTGIDWLFLYFFLWPIVYLIAQRSWWEMPRGSKRTRRRPEESPATNGGRAPDEPRTWDPVDRWASPPR